MIDKDSLPLDKPRRTPDHPTKSHVVKTRVDGKEKIIRFGEQGASTAGKPKEGESDRMKQKRASFKARHAKNIAKGKSSPAYWANKVKWKTGGAVGLEELDEKYEGIKKPDFSLLESFQDLIRTLQSKAADAGTQEFDSLRALGRSGAAGSLEDLYEAYSDEPRPHSARAEAGGNANPDRAKSARMVFDSFKAAGFSDAQARALTAEINRENVFNPVHLFGTHTDAANRATNVGMLSWQGDRADRLMSFMADRGLIDPAGRIVPGQDALNAQAEYLRWEMENDPSYARTRETFLSNPEIDPETAHDILGKNFIRWRIDDPKYRGSGFDRISEGYDILNMAQGYKEGGKVEKDELAEAERLRDLQFMAEERNPNAVPAVKPGMLDLPGGVVDRLALINKYLNPVEAIGEAMRAGSRLTSADASGYDRLAALGDMLSGVAGVAGPAAVAKRVGTPAAAAVVEALTGGAPAANAAPFGKDWSDVYHWSRSPDDFSEFDLNQSKSAMSQLGPHVGTPQAAEARYMGFAKPEGVPPALGFTLPMKADLSKPFLNPVTGKPWTEMDLEMFISAVSDTNSMDRRLVAPFIRERLAKEGYTSIPYMNDVEDAGSVSHIMLADRPTGSDAVLRSRFAKFDPAMRASKNISAGVAAGAIGASQYDPDAIEARASKAGKNEFAAGGAVKYDPSAVDRIINQLREVNRG
jgi:hypothetical protein